MSIDEYFPHLNFIPPAKIQFILPLILFQKASFNSFEKHSIFTTFTKKSLKSSNSRKDKRRSCRYHIFYYNPAQHTRISQSYKNDKKREKTQHRLTSSKKNFPTTFNPFLTIFITSYSAYILSPESSKAYLCAYVRQLHERNYE